MMVSKRLTQERVMDLLDYDTKTGGFVWKYRINNGLCVPSARNGRVAGCINSIGYITIGIDGKCYGAHRLAWLFVYGYLPENDIDHINRNRTDNSLSNLREVSRQCNTRNTGNHKTNTSGVKGVEWKRRANLWCARMSLNNKSCHLGYYKDFDDAVCARLAGEQSVNWSTCGHCSPAFLYVQKMLNG